MKVPEAEGARPKIDSGLVGILRQMKFVNWHFEAEQGFGHEVEDARTPG